MTAMMSPVEVFERFAREPGAFRRVPLATYRLQLDRAFTFRDARDAIGYLETLGITDYYLSPFFQPSSTESHGYDVSDPGRFNPVLGTEADYRALTDELRARDMGVVIDVVPNHMGIAGNRNAWWADVLEHGPSSAYAAYFDIDWHPAEPVLDNKILLPILGDQYGRVLENQELTLELRDGAFALRYYDWMLPVAPHSYGVVLRHRLDELEQRLGGDSAHVVEIKSIITALAHLPAQTETEPERVAERTREGLVVKRRLATLVAASPEVRTFLESNIRDFNGVKGEPASFDRLDQLLGAQVYRLAFWQVAADDVNYRRFFDINGLVAIRVEEPAVFEATHRLVFRLVREGRVTGLRIDHPDGLYAPREYFRQLQRRCFLARAEAIAGIDGAPEAEQKAWREALLAELDRRIQAGAPDLARPFYIVAEKILMPGERLPERWPVHGTTGYDVLNAINGVLIDTGAAPALDDIYARVIRARVDFRDVVYECKRQIIYTLMASEVNMLGHRLFRLSEADRASRDFTRRSLTGVLREIIACFPVYRTYVDDGDAKAAERDQRYIELAVAMAKRRNPTVSELVFDFIADVLCLRWAGARSEGARAEEQTFVGKCQQQTGPITAKGVEDTAFYRYSRLISLNEVGGAPSRFGLPVAEFHRLNAERQAAWPWSFAATATHDTKRGEDVRARIDVLSELAPEWREHVRRWRRLNESRKAMVEGQAAPSDNEEYFLYQTLLGAWPVEPVTDTAYEDFTERIQQYMFKALREAKLNTSWISPRQQYDAAMRAFIDGLLDRAGANAFLDDFLPFQRQVTGWGMYNSLTQTLLKLTVPGVPDFYQGTELWDLNLVDPDNRRPIDLALRRRLLEALVADIAASSDLAALARGLVAAKEDGRVKMYVIHRGLGLRRRHPALFLDGGYEPLETRGPLAAHVCAFARVQGDDAALTVAPRLYARRPPDEPPFGPAYWPDDTHVVVPPELGGRFRNVFTGELVEPRAGALGLVEACASFPVALLVRET
jgi:(1->4)-alpha-D-glucan 1-alpha-D-glucosylmutase